MFADMTTTLQRNTASLVSVECWRAMLGDCMLSWGH
jgi:hypothetical protein